MHLIKKQISKFLEQHPVLYEQKLVYLPHTKLEQLKTVIQHHTYTEYQALVYFLAPYADRFFNQPITNDGCNTFQWICQVGTYAMLNDFVDVLEIKKGTKIIVEANQSQYRPKTWLPILLIQEYAKAKQVCETKKIQLIESLMKFDQSTCNELLHLAAKLGELDCVKALLSLGANIQYKNYEQWTALH